LERNRDGKPRKGSVILLQQNNSLLTEREFRDAESKVEGCTVSRTEIFNIRLVVVWTYRKGDRAAE